MDDGRKDPLVAKTVEGFEDLAVVQGREVSRRLHAEFLEDALHLGQGQEVGSADELPQHGVDEVQAFGRLPRERPSDAGGLVEGAPAQRALVVGEGQIRPPEPHHGAEPLPELRRLGVVAPRLELGPVVGAGLPEHRERPMALGRHRLVDDGRRPLRGRDRPQQRLGDLDEALRLGVGGLGVGSGEGPGRPPRGAATARAS